MHIQGFRCNRADISGGETAPSGWGAPPLRPSALTAICERRTGRGGPPLGVVPRPPGHKSPIKQFDTSIRRSYSTQDSDDMK